MLFQSQFSVIAGVLAMFHGFDSHCCDSVTLTLPDTIPPPQGTTASNPGPRPAQSACRQGKAAPTALKR